MIFDVEGKQRPRSIRPVEKEQDDLNLLISIINVLDRFIALIKEGSHMNKFYLPNSI